MTIVLAAASSASCANCPKRYLVPRDRAGQTALLECRAKSPTPDPIQRFAVWPNVKPTDVCAEHPEFKPLPPPAEAPAQTTLPL
jgi:hypothetical protein